jgi:hypothetical protein
MLAYTPQTTAGVNKIYRKVQGDLQTGIQYECEEYAMLEDLQDFKIDVSAREITVPIDINEGAGVASIVESGFEANPYSPNVEEITLTWINVNKRFSASMTAMYLDEHSPEASIKKELLHKGAHAVRDVARDFSDRFYGFSTGVLALNTTVATQGSGTYTIGSGYGLATITNAAFIADKFRVGDRVALIRAGALVTNAVGSITAINTATPSLTITWKGSVTSANNDQIVKANSVGNGDSANPLDDTDFNKSLVGLLDVNTSTSVHQLSSASVAAWAPSFTDATGGRHSGIRFHRARQEMANKGPYPMDTAFLAQGVERDLVSLQQAALRFNDPFAMELDGSVKTKGLTFKSTRRVPPTYTFGMAKKSYKKILIRPKQDGKFRWQDGYKMQDQNAMLFATDWPLALVTLARRSFVYWSGLTES